MIKFIRHRAGPGRLLGLTRNVLDTMVRGVLRNYRHSSAVHTTPHAEWALGACPVTTGRLPSDHCARQLNNRYNLYSVPVHAACPCPLSAVIDSELQSARYSKNC